MASPNSRMRAMPYYIFCILFTVFIVYLRPWQASQTAPGTSKFTREDTTASAEGESVDLTSDQLSSIKIETLTKRTFDRHRETIGSIDFNQNKVVQVFPPYQGRIASARLSVGDHVDEGDILFTIESPDLLQAESTLISAAGVLSLQNRTLTRQNSLVKIGGAAQKDVDQAISDQQSAEGALRAARDALRIFGKSDQEIDAIVSSRKADSSLIVHSPISGTITARSAAPGLFVQPGTAPAPFTVVDTSTMWMLANIVENDSTIYHVGQKVEVYVGALPDLKFDGTLTTIGANVDPVTRRFYVRSEVPDSDHLLRAGMFATFRTQIAAPLESLAAPISSVVREGDGTFSVWSTKDKHRFLKRTIKIGLQQEGFDQIVDGLDTNDLIVTDGAVFLSNKLYGGATD